MADNVTLLDYDENQIVMATDEIDGVHVNRSKATFGPDGTAVDVATDNPFPVQLRTSAGVEIATAAAPLRIDPTGSTPQPITDNGGSITVDGTVDISGTVTVAAHAVTLATLPDTSAGDLAAIRAALGGTLTVGSHAVTQSGTWTVDLGATDNAVLDDIAAKLGGTLTVGTHAVTLATLPDTSAGDLAAIRAALAAALTVNLGAVDNAVLDAIAASLAGTLTVATHAVTQSGSWTVDLGATDNAVLDDIAAKLGGTLVVNGSGVVQPISAESLPLPTGAATAANQATAISSLATIAGAIAGTEMQADILTLPSLPAGSNNIGDVDVLTLPALPAGSNTIGAVNLAQYTAVSGRLPVDGSGVTQPVSLPAGTPYFNSSVGTTVQTIKASAGSLYALEIQNKNAVDCWIQIFDIAGTVTLGASTPKQSLLVPKGNGTDYGAMGQAFVIPIAFANAIKIACTTTPTGSGAPSTGLVVNGVYA